MEEVQFEHILSKEYDGCTANFLKLGDTGIMFDCGIDESAESSMLSTYDAFMPRVDVILLTHATFRHCGALPYLQKKYDFSKISVYATFPVNKLASTCMYEYYISQKNLKDFELFEIEDIDNVFKDVIPVNFHQAETVKVKESSFKITALNAGYSLGGAIWMINFNTHKLVYAIDVNDKNESITEPLRMGELRDAHFLITNTYIAPSIDGKKKSSRIQPTLSKERLKYHIKKTLLENLNFDIPAPHMPEGPLQPQQINPSEIENKSIIEVLENYGLTGKDSNQNLDGYPFSGKLDSEILICCDNFSRVLEVLLFLEDFADQNPDLQKIPILYLEHMSKEYLEIAKSHIEWMNNRLKSTFVYIDINPMNFKSITVLSKEEELQNYPNPRIVVSTTSSFLLGHTRNLLPKVLTNKKSKLIFINKQLSHPLGAQLIKQDMINYTHKKVTVTKRLKEKEVVMEDNNPTNVDTTHDQGISQLRKISNTDQNKQTAQEKDMEVDGEEKEEEIDFDLAKFNQRLYAKSDYPMFSFGAEDEIKVMTDAYGVYSISKSNDLYLNSLAQGVAGTSAYLETGLEDLGLNFGPPSLNNCVSYDYIRDQYTPYTFLYTCIDETLSIECQTAYIPFEGRIDKKSFQIMLCETRPKNIIIVNASEKKSERIKHFVLKNQLNINVFFCKDEAVRFKI